MQGGYGFSEVIPLWGGTRVQILYAPGGLWEGCMMSQEIETSPPEHTPLWGGPMWALELNHPWIDPCEV